jgi:hypothetical protein
MKEYLLAVYDEPLPAIPSGLGYGRLATAIFALGFQLSLPYPSFSGQLSQMLKAFPQYSGVGDNYDSIDNSSRREAAYVAQSPVHVQLHQGRGDRRQRNVPQRISSHPHRALSRHVGHA